MNNSNPLPDMAMEAIENLLISGDQADIRESLKEFFFAWLVSDDDHDLETRREKLFHYIVIHGLLKEAEEIQQARETLISSDEHINT